MFNKAIEEAVLDRENPAYLVLIDVDNFKRANDMYGHSVGDKVLQKLAGLLQESFGYGRNNVSRWGGDEFAVIYYGDKAELERRLEEIKKSFRGFIAPYNGTGGISFSSASVQADGSVGQVLLRADRSLYQDKQKKHLS